MYTVEEKIQMFLWAETNSSRKVVDMFAVEYPNRPIPDKNTILRIVKKFKSEGCIAGHNARNRTKTVLTEQMQLNILCYVEDRPFSSLREIASALAISPSSVRNALTLGKFKSYKVQNHQQLFEEDKIKRTDFCETMFNRLNEDDTLLHKICFTDEATFSLNGTVNSQNYRYWSTQNEHIQAFTHVQYRDKVNVWLGILGNFLIGPFFIDGTLNSDKYRDLLTTKVIPRVHQIGLVDPWYQHDGAPPHSTRAVTRILNDEFPNRWIGRYGPILWPPRSPDLSPNDYFLWSYLKSKIYSHRQMENMEELKNKITVVCNELNGTEMLTNVVAEFHHRLGYCLEKEGGHFENYLK